MNIDQLIQSRGKQRRFVAKGVLAEAQAEAQAEQAERAKKVLKGMFNRFDGEVDDAVDLVRELRQQANKQGKYAERLSRAVAYFNAEGNPLPVFKVQGDMYAAGQFFRDAGLGELPEENNAAWVVPGDWVEPVAEKAAE